MRVVPYKEEDIVAMTGMVAMVVVVAEEALQQEEVAGGSGTAGLGQVIPLHSSRQNSWILL